MAYLPAPSIKAGFPAFGLGTTVSVRSIVPPSAFFAEIPAGSLRIGGDSPNGLVLVGAAPASRTVDLFDRETKVFVASTVSAGDGTYQFTGLSYRALGYDVVFRGVLSSGERDLIIPAIFPG